MGCTSSAETKDSLYTGTLSLTGAHPSTAVSDGGKKIKCTTTRSCTNYSNEVFTDRDDVHVTVLVEKRMGDRVMVGLVVADKLDHCGSYACGDKEIDGSIGCGIVDGEMILRKGGRTFFQNRCDTSDPTDIHMSFGKGKLSFRIGRCEVKSDELAAMTFTGRFRLGVSVIKEGQVVVISHCSKEAPAADALLPCCTSSAETEDSLCTETLSLTDAHPSTATSDGGKIKAGQVAVIAPACVHRDVTERVIAFLSVPQQACARRASKALWKAVAAASMEDLLRATVLEHQDDEQLVVVAMSRVSAPFPCGDALVAWSGGLGSLYDELQLRFPHAAAIGISARLAAIRPFSFASGSTTMTVCVVTAAASAPSALVIESVVLCVRNAANVLVRTLSFPVILLDLLTSPCPSYCARLSTVELLKLPPLCTIGKSAFQQCESLQSISLTNLPHLESLGDQVFSWCVHLSTVSLSDLPSLRSIGEGAFRFSESLQSIGLSDLPLLESVGDCAFAESARLSTVDLSDLPSLRSIGEGTFRFCESLQSIGLESLPLLESIGDGAFTECTCLSTVNLSGLPSLRSIGEYAFHNCTRLSTVNFSGLPSLRTIGKGAFIFCKSLQSISFSNLPLLESIGDGAFTECTRLSTVNLTGLPLRSIGEGAFRGCKSLQSISLANLPLLESIGNYAFAECARLSTVDLSSLASLRSIGSAAFQQCGSLQLISLGKLPVLESIGACAHLSSVDLSRLRTRCMKYKRGRFV